MTDPFSPDSSHSQLIREAKVGLSIVMVVLVSVLYWSFHRYQQIRHNVPDHIRNAPVATQVGPDSYLDDPEVGQQSPESMIADQIAKGPADTRRERHEDYEAVLGKTETVSFESDVKRPDTQAVGSPADMSTVDGSFTAGSPSTVLVSLTEKVDRLEKLAESLMDSKSATHSFPPAINQSVNPLQRASRDISASLPAYEAGQSKTRSRKRRTKEPLSEEPVSEEPVSAENDDNDGQFRPQRPHASEPAADRDAAQLVTRDADVEPVDYQRDPVDPEASHPADDETAFRPVEGHAAPAAEKIAAEATDGRPVITPRPMSIDDEGTYQTQEGDSFWTIAELKYGDGRFFRALYEHNRSMIEDFDRLTINTLIKTPSLDYLKLQYRNLCPPDQLASDSSRRVYTTIDGDTLFDIARRSTGQASRYLELLKLNRDRLPMGANHLTRLPPDIQLMLPQ